MAIGGLLTALIVVAALLRGDGVAGFPSSSTNSAMTKYRKVTAFGSSSPSTNVIVGAGVPHDGVVAVGHSCTLLPSEIVPSALTRKRWTSYVTTVPTLGACQSSLTLWKSDAELVGDWHA